MTENAARAMMELHGITAAHRVVYHYKGFEYGTLTEALNYAEIVTSRADELAARKSSGDKRNDQK